MSSNFSQWFWKYGYIAAVPLALLGFWVASLSDRENQSNVNPEVFAYFEKVEKDCNAEDFNHQSKACIEIIKYQQECKKFSVECNSLTFYELLKQQGFALPIYYKEGYSAK